MPLAGPLWAMSSRGTRPVGDASGTLIQAPRKGEGITEISARVYRTISSSFSILGDDRHFILEPHEVRPEEHTEGQGRPPLSAFAHLGRTSAGMSRANPSHGPRRGVAL